MEELKDTLVETGRRVLTTALQLLKDSADAAGSFLGRAAGHVVAFASNTGSTAVKTVAGKVKTFTRDNRQTLLLIGAVVSGLLMAASLIGFLLGKKR
ncbi:MAG: hypothetical protein E7426_08695 [Ruminococcaceae bacterium]|jgi:hypothetical protein|nr:hypothetical protein [Oscillospiraceae bacterium]